MSLLREFLLVTAALAMAGCSTSRNPSHYERRIAARTGMPIQWNRSQADADEIQKALRPMLQKDLTIESAVHIALLNNPDLQAQLEEIGIAQADLIQAGLLKNIELAASWRVPEHAGVVNAEYALAGDFLDILLIPLRKKVAARNLEAVTSRVSYEVISLAAAVKTAFYTLQAHQQLLARLHAIVEVNEAAMDLARRQQEVGNITDLEWLNQQNAYTHSRLAIAETQRELRRSREHLNRLLGLWGSDTNWNIEGDLPQMPRRESDLRSLESMAVKQRPDLTAARQNLDNAGYALALRTKTRYAPVSINLGVNAERETDRSWLIGPTLDLEIPIFDRGQGVIPRLRSQYRQSLRALEQLAIDTRSQVREKRDDLIAARDLAEYYDKVLLPQRKRAVSESLLQYNAMQLGTFELLSAKERELQAEREHTQSLRDYWIARVELERALGGHLPASTGSHIVTDNESTATKPAASEPSKKVTTPGKSHEHNH